MAPFEGDLKQAIIQASLQIGAQLGEDGLTMRGIAARLGVSATALYQHFDSKAAILRAIRLDGLERLRQALPSARCESLDGLVEHGFEYVEFARKNPWLYGVILGRDVAPGEALDTNERELQRVPLGIFERCIGQVRDAGAVPATFDAASAAIVVWSALHGIALLLISGRIRTDHPLYPIPDEYDFIRTFVRCTIHSLQAPELLGKTNETQVRSGSTS